MLQRKGEGKDALRRQLMNQDHFILNIDRQPKEVLKRRIRAIKVGPSVLIQIISVAWYSNLFSVVSQLVKEDLL